MTLKALLAVLLSLKNTSFQESPERAHVVAAAIHEASGGDRRVAALLVSVGYHESRFLDRIQAGECKRFECDPIVVRGQVRFQSRSYFQLQRRAAASREEWASTTGLAPESIAAAARVAGRRLRRGIKACGSDEGAVAWYAFGSCRWAGATGRARMARRVESKLSE